MLIREISATEYPLLPHFLYLAIFQVKGTKPLPYSISKHPDIKIYIDGFGKKNDWALVCIMDQKIVGIVWTRILDGKIKGFGHIDSNTPELAISILPEYRNQKIGYKLMKNMIELLKENEYTQISLSVDKENYALKLYLNLGFEITATKEKDYIMLLKL